MPGKPNQVLLTAINSNANAEEILRKQRVMVSAAISSWSPGGGCHKEKRHIPGYCERQKGYFTEALNLIEKHLKKFNRMAT